jgi:Holliday junction DNA helicase RuvA
MISTLRGTVLVAAGSTAVIDVGGVGFSVAVTPALALSLRVGSEAMLHTALIVREDELSLFGFADADELAVFDRLRSVSGVGPKSALAVLGTMSASEIAAAVAADDEKPFTRVSGIGPKTAKLIVVSLAGKLDFVVIRSAQPAASSAARDVVIALVGLGWPERVAAQTVDEIVGSSAEQSVPALLRLALAELGPRAVERA